MILVLMGNIDFFFKWGVVLFLFGVGFEGVCFCCFKSCVGDVGY